jgi:hypothetical protein
VKATALATTVSTGWYQRRREQTKAREAAKPDTDLNGPIRAIAPPSVTRSGPYSVSQPQAEQQMSRGGVPPAGPGNGLRGSAWR